MKELRHWFVVFGVFLQYFFYRLGLARRPNADGIHTSVEITYARVFRARKRIRLRGIEHIPEDHTMIFCSNHLQKDDPFLAFCAISQAMGQTPPIGAMIRDDFFDFLGPFKRFCPMDDFLDCIGVHGVTRGRATLAQMRPFLKLMENGQGFLMYPGATRSRSGLFMEYRDRDHKPGAVSLFLHHAQRRRPERTASAVPMARTFNPVTKRSTFVFGAPQQLQADPSRAALREFDCHLVEVLASLVELNVPMVLSTLLYLRCLHGRTGPITDKALYEAVGAVFEATDHPYVNPADREDIGGACRQTIAYLHARGMLTHRAGEVSPKAQAILSVPKLDYSYRKHNAVKFLANQVVHLDDVVRLIDAQALEEGPVKLHNGGRHEALFGQD